MIRSYKNVLSVFLMATVLLATSVRDAQAIQCPTGHKDETYDCNGVVGLHVGTFLAILGVVYLASGPSKLANHEGKSPNITMDSAAVLAGNAPSAALSEKIADMRNDHPGASDDQLAMQLLEE